MHRDFNILVSSPSLCRSGNVYEGEWHLNERHGRGTMQWWDRGECYSGEWVGGIQHGQGEHTWFISTTDNAQVSCYIVHRLLCGWGFPSGQPAVQWRNPS